MRLEEVSSETHAASATTDYHELLRLENLDAVFVSATPEHTHYPMAKDSLEAGKHVISDKPPCIRLDELDEIESLASHKGLKVGCMFDSRDLAPFIGLCRRVRAGEIGEVHAIVVAGQHPLMRGSRPE